ncbi:MULTISPECIES: hypothetical protein [unclassified Paraflavitalea]|uniref:hypothetical protein n=1 Tax=unclassified Paraflavitalea TaxID=2798305 RepID=UPI003D348BB2
MKGFQESRIREIAQFILLFRNLFYVLKFSDTGIQILIQQGVTIRKETSESMGSEYLDQEIELINNNIKDGAVKIEYQFD